MGWFSKSSNYSYFDDSWDKDVNPTSSGEEVYASRYGSREFVASVPNSSGISRCKWVSSSYGTYIMVTCKDGKTYNVYENKVEKLSL